MPGGLTVDREYAAAYMVAYAFAFAIGLTMGYAAGPFGASVVVDVAIVAYAVLLSTYVEARWIPLSLAIGTHLAAILSYYSHPIPLPFLILERGKHGYTMNIDLVQALIGYDLLFEYHKQGQKEETLKTPTSNDQEQGTPEEPP